MNFRNFCFLLKSARIMYRLHCVCVLMRVSFSRILATYVLQQLREDIDLAAVKTFFWKSGDDIALHYTLRKGWWFKPPHYLVRSNSPPSYSSSSSSASSLDCNGHTS